MIKFLAQTPLEKGSQMGKNFRRQWVGKVTKFSTITLQDQEKVFTDPLLPSTGGHPSHQNFFIPTISTHPATTARGTEFGTVTYHYQTINFMGQPRQPPRQQKTLEPKFLKHIPCCHVKAWIKSRKIWLADSSVRSIHTQHPFHPHSQERIQFHIYI